MENLLGFLFRNIAKKTRKMESDVGINAKLFILFFGKIVVKSNILGERRKSKVTRKRVENCIIQCVLSIFLLFID